MSVSHEVSYTCPYCGKHFEITVYDSISAEADKDLRDRCLSGEVFQQLCPHCNKEFLVQNDLLYVDPYHKFVLFVSDKEVPEAVKKAVAGPLVKQGYKLRRCATVREFTEKISIFEDGADDVLVELARYDSFIEFVDNKKGKPEEVTSVDYERYENDVMKINVRTADKGMAFIIPVSMLEEEIASSNMDFTIDPDAFSLVNSDWLMSLFKESAGVA